MKNIKFFIFFQTVIFIIVIPINGFAINSLSKSKEHAKLQVDDKSNKNDKDVFKQKNKNIKQHQLNMTFQEETNKKNIESLMLDVKRINRDQLNYKIEKNLLKEAYASNLQTINIIITIILAFFSVVGIGMGYWMRLQIKHYSSELEKFNILKNQVEKYKNKIISDIKVYKKQYELLDVKNKEQDIRLDYIEYLDKIQDCLKNNDWAGVLENCEKALEVEADSSNVMRLKAVAHVKLNEMQRAAAIYESMIERNVDVSSVIHELAEVYLLLDEDYKYKQLIDKHKEILNSDNLIGKFKSILLIKSFLDKNKPALIKNINEIIEMMSEGNISCGWEYNDALKEASRRKYSDEELNIFKSFVKFIERTISHDELIEVLTNE